MSTNKLSHLTEGEKIYLEVTRKINKYHDDDDSLFFESKEDDVCVSDDDTFYTLDELKQLANDGMPKQGEIFLVTNKILGSVADPIRAVFVCNYKGKNIFTRNGFDFEVFYEFELLKQKTELTLAEVEERLGLDAGSLIIK